MPQFLREALLGSGRMAAFQSRPAYQRNDYIGWITRAKLPQTQRRRLQQVLDELGRGDVIMQMRWNPR